MCDCVKCNQAHETIEQKVDALTSLLEFHQAEVHGSLVERDEIRKWDGRTESKVDKLADAIMGPQTEDYDGEWHRQANRGLVAKVEANTAILEDHSRVLASIDHQVHNGIKMKLDPKVWAAIITTLISTLGLIVIALINSPPG